MARLQEQQIKFLSQDIATLRITVYTNLVYKPIEREKPLMKTRLVRLFHMFTLCLIMLSLAVPASYAADDPKHGRVYISDLRASQVTADSVTLEWTPAIDTVYVNVHYSGADKNEVVSAAPTASSYTVSGLAPDTTYRFDLQGQCAQCQQLVSNTVTVKTSPKQAQSEVVAVLPKPANVKIDTNRVIMFGSALKISSTSDANGIRTATAVMDDTAFKDALVLLASLGSQAKGLVLHVDDTADSMRYELAMKDLTAIVPQTITLSVLTPSASYDLPLQVLDYKKLAEQYGASIDNMKVSITVSKLSGAALETMNKHAAEQGLAFYGVAYDYAVAIMADGKSEEFQAFGQTYITRSIIVNGSSRIPGSALAVRYDPLTGQFAFVPSEIITIANDTHVLIKRPGNSIYAIAQVNNRTFTDLKTGHWAKDAIELLASKLVLEGRSASTFEPSAAISRAEFTAMLVRSLALSPEQNGASFQDVATSDWHAGAIGAAVQAGLVRGFADGSFQPDAPVTRAQMAVMIAAALPIADRPIDVTGKEADLLSRFADADSIPAWATNATAQTLLTKIIEGNPDNTFNPSRHATRAEAAVIIKRFLTTVNFIS
jgi:hypothetical protein